MKKILLYILVPLLLAGCNTVVTPEPLSGSRADGTVILGYKKYEFHNVREQGGLEAARYRCKSWGYDDAEFLGREEHCEFWDAFVCGQAQVKLTYQCTSRQ